MIDRIISTPIEKLRFNDFARLKSGRDQFSRIQLRQLRSMVSAVDSAAVDEHFDDIPDKASCLRWVLRGLPIDKAIRKVKTDLEIRGNAIDARQGITPPLPRKVTEQAREAREWESGAYGEPMNAPQIAARMGLPLETVQSYLNYSYYYY